MGAFSVFEHMRVNYIHGLGLLDIGLEKQFYGNNEFAKDSRHVNDIESFWSKARASVSAAP